MPVAAEELDLRKIVGDVAAAYFSNSHVTPAEIPTVISQIASSLLAVGAPAQETPAEAPAEPKLTSAQIRKSITRDALISFEDNKPYKTLRRHLAVRGLTPEEYRSKWGLSKDYPMVSPGYSEARSSMAKALGLGSRLAASRAKVEPAAALVTGAEPTITANGPQKGRRSAPTRARKARTPAAKAGTGK
jgi:predicted transcriptional regulator